MVALFYFLNLEKKLPNFLHKKFENSWWLVSMVKPQVDPSVVPEIFL
jgi:hypothetical protein